MRNRVPPMSRLAFTVAELCSAAPKLKLKIIKQKLAQLNSDYLITKEIICCQISLLCTFVNLFPLAKLHFKVYF